MCTTLVLWDIDHTLMVSGPAATSVYPRAFTLLTGRAPTATVETEGRTERAILQELLALEGVTGIARSAADRAMVRSLRAVAKELRDHSHALPGAREALTALRAEPRVIQSLLTGNLLRNAVRKLRAVALHECVEVGIGAYGSDSAVRADLVGIAQQRARHRYGAVFGPDNTVVLGDTVRDVRAARAGGARPIAVATGTCTLAELRAAGAESVLPDLRDTDAVLAAVLGGRPPEGPRPEDPQPEDPQPREQQAPAPTSATTDTATGPTDTGRRP
ncbi:HAD family hydrolase [Streptomyces sp. TM32]|uniref:HAD family hydrolase n=1 Tax=Streptomyces sp. TM32 TaxID=1652669 RepID=UPI001012A028|nr:HAD family hydrolase [Streptomyces sp. TM32]RXS88427.1 HAD family hydrolase [Streptomyces sp. TM32]